jgi:hypothetical protein
MNDPFDWTMGSLFNNVNLIDSLDVCQAEWCSGCASAFRVERKEI